MTATNIRVTQTTFPHYEQTSQIDIKVSVILPCLNSSETIGVQLEALAKQSWDQSWELIVSDNGSTDRTLDVVEGYKHKIRNLRIVDSSTSRGCGHGRNVGAVIWLLILGSGVVKEIPGDGEESDEFTAEAH